MKNNRVLWILLTGIIIALSGGAFLFIQSQEPRLKAAMVQAIEKRFDSTAELQDLQLSVFPRLNASGKKLVLRYHGRTDIPPLITIEKFSVTSTFSGAFSTPIHIAKVNLEGLVIQIPPDEENETEDSKISKTNARENSKSTEIKKFVISQMNADGAVLKILPKKQGKEPMVFELHKLQLEAVGLDQPMQYRSTLKNAKPPGMIESRGNFGPWNSKVPGQTPLSGDYTFNNADLSVFKGIAGTLSSTGSFKGVLESIEVDGVTDVPDFMVRTGQRLHLKTKFHAIVDGTSGDTYLKPVIATFEDTTIICDGGIVQEEGVKGKAVILNVKLEEGRMEDIMKFAIRGKPPLIGSIRFQADMKLPPGDADVIEKLRLNGSFGVGSAEFTSNTVQNKIEELSLRSRGRHDDATDERIASDLLGNFVLRDSVITFTKLSFSVPGAKVQLEGKYGLASEQIDFTGALQMQAKLSETQTGIKSILLKIVDPFFKGKKGGSELPIKITGTRENPKFGLNFGGKKKADSRNKSENVKTTK